MGVEGESGQAQDNGWGTPGNTGNQWRGLPFSLEAPRFALLSCAILRFSQASVALRIYLEVTREQNLAIALALTQPSRTAHTSIFPLGTAECHIGTLANCAQ